MALSVSSTTKISIASAVVLLALVLATMGCSPKAQDEIVATVGPDVIKLSDYEKLYLKSNGTQDSAASTSQEDREKFLELMVKYRLKLADAYRQGIDRKPEVLNEIAQYKGSLASSFLTERDIITPGVRRLYQLRTEEIRASHILTELVPNAAPAESIAAYQKAYGIIKTAKAGEDFAALAQKYSSDPSAKENKGDLYYFTAGQLVPPFEDAVYAMKPGEISSAPVRSQFGLHIIKVVDRKPAAGETHCAHIMIRFHSMAPTPEDTLSAYTIIHAIQDSLIAGVDFGGLAIRNSGDPASAPKGGDLGWFSRRRWVVPFDEAAFGTEPGHRSRIIRTAYGYHIIKCFETRPTKTFDEAKQEIQKLYQETRFPADNELYIAKLKKELRYSRNDAVITRLLAACDSSKTVRDSAWAPGITPELRAAAIISFGGKPVTVDSVVNILKSRTETNVVLRASVFVPALEKVAEQLTFAAMSDLLEKQDPGYAAILKEYREGILLYQVEQENVWNKVVASDSLLRTYFADQRDKYTQPDMLRVTELRTVTENGGWYVYKQVKAGKTFEQIAETDSIRMKQPNAFSIPFSRNSASLTRSALKSLSGVAAQMSADSSLRALLAVHPDTSSNKAENIRLATRRLSTVVARLTTGHGLPAYRVKTERSPKGPTAEELEITILGRQPLLAEALSRHVAIPSSDHRAKLVDSVAIGGTTAPMASGSRFLLTRLDAREPARPKTYEEATAEISTAFQEHESKRLEANWMNLLRTRYPVVEHKQLLKDAFAPIK